MDFSTIRESIMSFRVFGEKGYAYVLAPNSGGDVTVHRDLVDEVGDGQNILSVEKGVDGEEFGGLVDDMYANCRGWRRYKKNGKDSWILAWDHENATSSTYECEGGFIVVLTVEEDVLLEVGTALIGNG